MWILVGILILGLMILVHEWGHFVVAKLFGVRVNVFSLGFGPRLFGVRRGATDYRVSALPLGGYVSMAGESPMDERSGALDEFLSKPRWQRVLIALAGPAMNILVAVLVLAGLYYSHYERAAFLEEPAVVAAVLPDSPAEEAGIEPGDIVVRFGGARRPTWEDLLVEAALANNQAVGMEVERQGESVALQLAVPEEAQRNPWKVGWIPDVMAVVRRVQAGSPAEQAGLQPGDVLLALNGRPVRVSPGTGGYGAVSQWLQKLGGQAVTLTIEREGVRQPLTVTPTYGDDKRWILGFEYAGQVHMVSKELTLWQAMEASVRTNANLAVRMVDLVGRLFTGRVSLGSVQGPVGIVDVVGRIGEQAGLPAVVNLMALISLSLGILNLLPIPVLDGGHIAFLAVEGMIRRDLSLRLKERVMQAGIVFILLVFVVVMYNDIARIIRN
ncbi:RIP metalloprotease RseP [Acidobacteriia bacterium AH_259_A11_L15]|nr:RIP metalloprotease RseP [Acidobacteriia bacterium AH_259_A11_L15]